MANMLSSRGARSAAQLDVAWRYAPSHTYDAEFNPSGLISFGMAEHLPLRADMVNFINNKVEFTEDSIGYRANPTWASRLPRALAAHLNRILAPSAPIAPEDVIVACSATALSGVLGFALAEPSDGILVSRPVYGRFELDYGIEAGVQIVYADSGPEEAFTTAVVDRYEAALHEAQQRGVTVRAVVLVNPHNPVGRCYPVETLEAVLRFCNKHRLHVIADEIYASCVFPTADPAAVPFTSVLALDLPALIDPVLVHLLYGFSKDFASGGLHLGFLITRNEAIHRVCKAVMRLHNPSAAAVTIGTAILEGTDFIAQFTTKSQQHLASTYAIVTATLTQEGINYVKGVNAGFFVYIDLSPYLPTGADSDQEREFALAQKFLDAGVFLHPGEEHNKHPGWFRLVHAHHEHVLREGLRR
ncbi:1-aminocyclopropane-1-carboxylate synthase [Aspergillus taichungensis]|uniref:1-aminocyclopropane-1-carboxylate synthase n=1 Tax=Aspergillus taichungensis TaxID=482145 RepID=A0A2J5HEK2_9EURO|nr:1-aminocyclopropane-1-carboxylate synthase [Aspergillus taichungensis]